MCASEFWDWVWLRFASSNPQSLALHAPPSALHTNAGETRLLTLAGGGQSGHTNTSVTAVVICFYCPPGTFLACHPNHIANVVAIVSTTQQYIPLREREKDVDQSAAAEDVSTELLVHAHSDTEEERHLAPRGVQMRMGEAFSRLCHCSVPLGPLVAAYGGKIAAPLRMVSRKSPGAQRALNRLMSVVGSPLQSRVCKALEGLDVPDGKCISELTAE